MRTLLFHAVLTSLLFSAAASMAKETDEQKRDNVCKTASETLDQLYKLQPSSHAAVEKRQ
jgi:hypothetical protein